jgi:heat shock protein HslJ
MFISILKFLKIIPLFFLFLFFIFGCNQSRESGTEEIKNKRWVLMSMPGRDSVRTETGKDVFLSLDNSNNNFNGQAPCNHYFGKYNLDGNNISFGEIGATRMACDNLDIEYEYFEQLKKINKYKIKNDILFLYRNDEKLLTFKAVWLY